MTYPAKASSIGLAVLAASLALTVSDPAIAQQLYDGYGMVERVPGTYGQQPVIFGVAAFKICQLKTFLFAAVYVLASIAFVVFAVRALFTKFEMKHFIPIIGAIFIVASADLFIAWMATDAFYCPTALSTFTNG